jgi:hypothetical protein
MKYIVWIYNKHAEFAAGCLGVKKTASLKIFTAYQIEALNKKLKRCKFKVERVLKNKNYMSISKLSK